MACHGNSETMKGSRVRYLAFMEFAAELKSAPRHLVWHWGHKNDI